MDTNLIAAIISASITTVGIIFAYIQWRRDVRIKLARLREEVTSELVKQRIPAYSKLMKNLEKMSVIYQEKHRGQPELILKYLKVFQDAVYGEVGLLAFHDTRKILIFCREGCIDYAAQRISYEEWLGRIRALHIVLRSDLGIVQPGLSNEVDKLQEQIGKNEKDRDLLTWVNSPSFGYKELLTTEE